LLGLVREVLGKIWAKLPGLKTQITAVYKAFAEVAQW
jgi:hypothetical protein